MCDLHRTFVEWASRTVDCTCDFLAVQLHATELQAAAPGSSAHFFTSYPVQDNQSEAAAEAIRQADVMMERMKTVHENSQAAYDASASLRANVQVSRLFDCSCSIRICYPKSFLLHNLLLFVSNQCTHWVFYCLW